MYVDVLYSAPLQQHRITRPKQGVSRGLDPLQGPLFAAKHNSHHEW